MARRNSDLDEFCDPDNPKPILYEDVLEAADKIKPFIIKTSCIPSHYQRDFVMNLYYKPEFLQKSGSFKERGSINALERLTLDKQKQGVVIASLGNDAIGFCYHAKKMKVPVTVVMPDSVPISNLQKCHCLRAKVLVQGSNLSEAQKIARTIAKERKITYINCRDHPQILAGYGTIALEILEQIPLVDCIIVPVGTGGLVAAIAAVVKHLKPNCLVYGVQTEAMPGFFKSLEMNQPTPIDMNGTVAHSIAVPDVGVNSFANVVPRLDKMLLVNEDWVTRSMLHLVEKERFVVEGAGACPLAAIIGNLVPELKLKYVVCILSGGNVDNIFLARCLERGLTAEGRLIKFTVGIKDNSTAKAQLMKLLANAGYNVVREFQDNVWVDDEVYNVEIKLVCETKGLLHALELKRIIEKAYPFTSTFETEPFNDRRTCACFVRKSM